MTDISSTEKKYNRWIKILSVGIPLVVALLFGVKIPNVTPLSFLPPMYATINGITAILLVIAVWMIKNDKKKQHERLMKSCIALSAAFLLMYMAYHMTSDATAYGGEGVLKYVYYMILISHIVLSIGVIPLVLITYVSAELERFERHKKMAKITFPIWLYVAVSGVVVYLMISPYYV